jgi:DNA-binding CsgD family transcriptional regulator
MDSDANVLQPAEVCSTSKQVESGLLGDDREIDAYVRQLLDTLPAMISIASPEGPLEYVNHELLEIVGVPFVKIAGTKWINFLRPDDAKRAFNAWLRQSTADRPFKCCLIALDSYPTGLLSRRACINPSRKQARNVEQRANERLSARECAVLALIANGQSNKRVAQTLKIAPETVKSHVKRTFVKLGAKTRAEAVARATELGCLGNTATMPIASYGSTASIRRHAMAAVTAKSSSREENETSVVGAL